MHEAVGILFHIHLLEIVPLLHGNVPDLVSHVSLPCSLDPSWSIASSCTVRSKRDHAQVLLAEYTCWLFQIGRWLLRDYSFLLKLTKFPTSSQSVHIIRTVSWSWHHGPLSNHVKGCVSLNNSGRSLYVEVTEHRKNINIHAPAGWKKIVSSQIQGSRESKI